MLTRDEKHGEENKAVLGEWLSTWVPQSLRAAHELQPIWSQPNEKVVTFADSLDAAKATFRSVLADLDLEAPKELDQ